MDSSKQIFAETYPQYSRTMNWQHFKTH